MTDAYRRKLIEVDLPLDAINAESAREKSIRHGHPSTLHLWWSRKPLAACRAVIFASMVDDPIDCPDEFPTLEAQAAERERLHDIIKLLVRWESTDENNPKTREQNLELLAQARWEIARSVARSRGEATPDGILSETAPGVILSLSKDDRAAVLSYLNDKALPIYDPFCGGGSIPLEAQRLGLRAVGSDLNPVAVLITKALIELPHQFANQPPVNPKADPMGMTKGKGKNQQVIPWRGAAGLADDIRYYGDWMRKRAWERIGHLYPKAKLPDGGEATVIAWLWARTVPCPNPACGVAMPLKTTFQASKKRGNEYWMRPVVDREAKTVSFTVQNYPGGVPPEATIGGRVGATCVACGGTAPMEYVREQARSGNMGEVMTAIVAEGDRKRLFLSPTNEHIEIAKIENTNISLIPWQKMPTTAYKVSGRGYGITHWHELFSERQLTGHTTFCDLIPEVRNLIKQDGGEEEYANAVCTYLALAIGRNTDSCSKFSTWQNVGDFVAHVFSRQAIAMVWDFAEANSFSESTQNWMGNVRWVSEVVERLPASANGGESRQADAANAIHVDRGPIIVTDPPYYDNISYAELSDFFYVWLRQVLRDIYPDLFAGIMVPIEEEMIAAPRFEDSRERFERLLGQTLRLIRERCSPEFPSSIFYAYKQQEEEREGRASTGWETMLTAVVNAGFEIVGTWPMRTERAARSNAMGTNALASSVVLVCRPRPEDAPPGSRREFLNALEAEMPAALDHLTREGHIAPVDLAQAAIGPGMQVYSRYSRVETIGGDPVTVRDALAAINQAIANYDERQEGEFDPPTRFCLDWLKQHGFAEGQYGEAQTLAQAKNVSIEDELRDAHGLVTAQGGSVRLQPPEYYAADRLPVGGRMTAWEGCYRMAWHFDHADGSTEGAADVARRMGSGAESVERLARVLYNHFDRIRDSRRAVLFNNLVTSWDAIQVEMSKPPQGRMALA